MTGDELISRKALIAAVDAALFPKIKTAKVVEKALRKYHPHSKKSLSAESVRITKTKYPAWCTVPQLWAVG